MPHAAALHLDLDDHPARRSRRIGVFDSGVGGLSVLRALHRRLPAASMLYVGDVACAPYGERSATEVIERCRRIVAYLAAQRAGLIVVACNTATALAIEHLRSHWPHLTFVGVEPGVKPAAALSRSRCIAVMVTRATASSERLGALVARHAGGAQVHLQACPGLADSIERGMLDGPALLDVLRPYCDAIRKVGADVVVLGCTHYPFVADSISRLLGPDVALIDTAAAIAQRVVSLRGGAEEEMPEPATVRIFSTGSTPAMRAVLQRCLGLQHLPVEHLTLPS